MNDLRTIIRKTISEAFGTYTKTLFHGSQGNPFKNPIGKYIFLTEDSGFAKDYGPHVYACKTDLGKVFDSTELAHIRLLYNHGLKLRDPYLERKEDEELLNGAGVDYNWEKDYYETAEDFIRNPREGDTWESIEESNGIIEWIFGNGFDSIKILEGGYAVNYYTKIANIISYELIS